MRVAIVTGSTSGIGRATALAFARMGFHLVAVGRSETKLSALIDEVTISGGQAEPLVADLASMASVAAGAERFATEGKRIEVLVNNAGVGTGRGISRDGFEIHFGVNHLGHFLLTRLLDTFLNPGARVVQVSSHMHYRARGIDFEAATRRTGSWFGVTEYAESKLANVLFCRELARRRPELATYAVHPGVVPTAVFPWYVRPLLRRSISPEEAADTIVWCATSDDAAGRTGLYWSRREERKPSGEAQDDRLAAELWERSEEWCRHW